MSLTKPVVLFLFLLLSSLVTVNAQVPFHFTLGEEELAGLEIYDIAQDSSGHYFVATDDGLFRYDGYDFHQYLHPKMLNRSIFRLIFDPSGVLHFHNLNGQIFAYQGDSLTIVHQIPDSLVSPYIDFNFLTDGTLVVNTEVTYRVINDKLNVFYRSKGSYFHRAVLQRLPDGNLLLANDSLQGLIITSSEYGLYKISLLEEEVDQVCLNLDHPILKRPEGSIYQFVQSTDSVLYFQKMLDLPGQEILFKRTSNYLVGCYLSTGVHIEPNCAAPGQRFSAENQILEGASFSNAMEDDRGNLLLGTFGRGILVIPPTAATNYPRFRDAQLEQISLGPGGSLLLGTIRGSVLVFDGRKVRQMLPSGSRRVDFLQYFPEDDLAIVSNGLSRALSGKGQQINTLKMGAIKDVVRTQNGNYLAAVDIGLRELQQNVPEIQVMPSAFSQDLYRSFALAYHPEENICYWSTAAGLFRLGDGEQVEIKYQDQPVFSRTMAYHQGDIYIGTQQHGLLVYKSKRLQPFLDEAEGLNSSQIDKILFHSGKLFVATPAGMQIFEESGKLIRTLGMSDGLRNLRIKDFVVTGKSIWLVTTEGLQRIYLPDAFRPTYESTFRRVNVLVNGQLHDQAPPFQLAHYQNRIQFEFEAPSLERREDLSYHFRLTGIDEIWSQQSYDNHRVTYKSLPPGEYVFEAKLYYKGAPADATRIAFEIMPPFWKQGWFLAAMAAALLLLAYTVSYWQLRRKTQRARIRYELNASRLATIQSQMNPHFIFNALTSIQSLVLKGNGKHAYSYITKFATLLRSTLNYSDKEFIDFAEEIQLIEIYLALEKLRFRDQLEYEIDRGGIEGILVPPMLVQPFIENALLHGLLPKKGDKRIEIQFSLQKNCLQCIVRDNGVGRKRAAEIKARKGRTHTSFSEDAIHKRFEILRLQYKVQVGFMIVDLHDAKGAACGTELHLTIPIQRRL